MNPLELLNISNVAEISTEQFIKTASSSYTAPALIFLFIAIALIYLIVGMIYVKESRGRFLMIWFSSIAISLVVLIVMIVSPNTMYMLIEKIKELFS